MYFWMTPYRHAMDIKPYNQIRQSGNPSKILMGAALIVALWLPYILVKKFTHVHQEDTIQQSVVLPNSLPYDKSQPKIATEQPAQFEIIEQHFEQAFDERKNTKPETKNVAKQILVSSKSSILKKTVTASVEQINNGWQIIRPRSGDSLAIIFHRLGLSAQNLNLVLHKNPYVKTLTSIKPSQEFQFLIKNNKLEKLLIPINDIQTLTVFREGAVYKTKVESKKTTTKEQYLHATVRGSLYITAKQTNIPSKLIQQMVSILGKQVDFVHSVRSGDQFSIAYEAQFIKEKKVGIGDIIAVNYTGRGKSAEAFRHISANGTREYYSAQGQSFKKSFSRYPVKFSHISSTFTTARYHPILHYKRAHKGIDLAAPIGTPILATGDGVIKSIGRHNGYGNMIHITHDKTYSSVYGHLLKFQKGLSKGSHVKRGQVIGYVGQTGLATGPHCHYELHVNSQPRNPTTTYLPTAASVPAREMARFKAKARNLFARLNHFDTNQIANNKSKSPKKTG